MSTRHSIHCSENVHIYRELIHGDFCIEIDRSASKVNEIYRDPVVSLKQLKQIKNDIEEYLGKYSESVIEL